MTKNIKDFLLEFGVEKLKQVRVLNKQGGPPERRDRLVLNRFSVEPLISLMKEPLAKVLN